jgi:hypothetical protein
VLTVQHIFKHECCSIVHAVCFGLTLGFASAAGAQASGPYEECQQILADNIMNTVSRERSERSSEDVYLLAEAFFMDERSAYSHYQSAYAAARSRNTTIDTNLSFGPLDDLVFASKLGSVDMMSASEFSEGWSHAKSVQRSRTVSSSSAAKAFSDKALFTSRDAASVEAWRQCVTKSEKMSITAFAARDNANEMYVGVVWTPGDLSGVVQAVDIEFVDDAGNAGVHVEAEPSESVGQGSGKSFAVRCESDACDRGFSVNVNTDIIVNGELVKSLTASVEVPAVPGATPRRSLVGGWDGAATCNLVFTVDDATQLEGHCDSNGYFHTTRAVYDAASSGRPELIPITITRRDPQGCETSVNGSIQIVDENAIIQVQEGWDGCGVTSGSAVTRLERVR